MKTLLPFLLLITTVSLFAQNNGLNAEKQRQIQEYIKHFESNNQLMGTVSIAENGKEILSKTFGPYNNAKSSRYAVGSITKMFTAILIAQLYESNKIGFDEKLSNYFPQVPNSNRITIKQMLNHTSGLKDYVTKDDSLYFWLTEPVEHKDIMQEIIRQGVGFQPGDSLSYSNTAYYLLARILEQIHQKNFEQILVANIVEPLALKNMVGVNAKSEQANNAKSYEKSADEWLVVKDFYFPNTSGVGNIYANGSDLNTVMQALFSERLIKASTLKAMLPAEDEAFGMGIMRVPFYEHIAYGHGGDTYGTHSVTSYNPENKLAISYIINGENYPTNSFAIGLLSIVYDKDFKLPDFKKYAPEERFYELYEGTYSADGFPMAIKVYLEEDQLKAQAEGQGAFVLSPVEKHVFEFLEAGIEIRFKPFENLFILQQGGQSFELKKQ